MLSHVVLRRQGATWLWLPRSQHNSATNHRSNLQNELLNDWKISLWKTASAKSGFKLYNPLPFTHQSSGFPEDSSQIDPNCPACLLVSLPQANSTSLQNERVSPIGRKSFSFFLRHGCVIHHGISDGAAWQSDHHVGSTALGIGSPVPHRHLARVSASDTKCNSASYRGQGRQCRAGVRTSPSTSASHNPPGAAPSANCATCAPGDME